MLGKDPQKRLNRKERKKGTVVLPGRRELSTVSFVAGRLDEKPCGRCQLFPWLAYTGSELSVSYIGTHQSGSNNVPKSLFELLI